MSQVEARAKRTQTLLDFAKLTFIPGCLLVWGVGGSGVLTRVAGWTGLALLLVGMVLFGLARRAHARWQSARLEDARLRT